MGNAWVSHQYFIAQDNARMGRNREIGTRTFPIVCVCFFPIQFPSYGILHYMGNAWCFVSISHSIGRSSKIHPVVKIWDKDTHIFPKAWLLFFHHIPTLWYSTARQKCMGFPVNFS